MFVHKVEINTTLTKDGSHTLYVPEIDEHYHSINGAVNESSHIFIQYGLQACKYRPVSILEVGFGTGLNAFLTLREAVREKTKITYHTIEKFPLPIETINKLNYPDVIDFEGFENFYKLHTAKWGQEVMFGNFFIFKKFKSDINAFFSDQTYDVIYFDAFSPEKQPEMWTYNIFDNLYKLLNKDGLLVTYSAKGSVRRTLQEVGFVVEKLPGPAGKREMMRGIKK